MRYIPVVLLLLLPLGIFGCILQPVPYQESYYSYSNGYRQEAAWPLKVPGHVYRAGEFYYVGYERPKIHHSRFVRHHRPHARYRSSSGVYSRSHRRHSSSYVETRNTPTSRSISPQPYVRPQPKRSSVGVTPHLANVPPRSNRSRGNNGVGNGPDPQPPGNPRMNDGRGSSPGNPGNRGGNGRSRGRKK
jgi:hypothetical protein